MPSRFLRGVASLELEEQILNSGAIVALLGIFMPWITGEWLGGDLVTYSGFYFYTSFVGLMIFAIEVFILILTILPLLKGPIIIKKRYREHVRFVLSLLATILTLAVLSVLMKVTFEFSRMEVRFGIYVTLIGNLICLLYTFLRLQEYRKSQAQELFRHPEDQLPLEGKKEAFQTPPLPPPPPAPEPEEHRLYP